MWSSAREAGLQRNSSSSDTISGPGDDSGPMELSLNQSMEGLQLGSGGGGGGANGGGGGTLPNTLHESLTTSDMLGGSAYGHSLGESSGTVGLNGSQVVEEMDLANSTDEAFEEWLAPPDLFKGCEVTPTTALRIGREIGSGAFSTIYIGQYKGGTAEVEMVAIKRVEISKKGSGKKAFPPHIMFNREVAFLKMLRQFRHPNIIRFVGACAVPPLIITEYVSGGSLFSRLHENVQDLLLPTRLFIAFGIANGMALLHEQGIIHRDLTSENVLLTMHDEPRIIDFGFAVQKVPSAHGELFTLRPAGNARWRAPEITLRLRYNRTVDVYSYGILLNEILSRQIPFSSIERSRDAATAATQGSRPTMNYQDKDLQVLVTRYWIADPAQRPSFETIKRDLNHLMTLRFQ